MGESQRSRGRSIRHIRNVLLAGILVAVPVVVTYLVFRWLFETLDGILQPIVNLAVGRPSRGAGLIALVIVVYLLGLVTTNVFWRRIIRGVDVMLCRMPVVQYVYSSARQVVDAIRNLRKTPFKRVVIVEFPRQGVQSIAFVTSKAIDVKGETRLAVFVPTAPNPLSGFVVLMSPADVTDTDLSVDEALRMVLSGGLLSPDRINAALVQQ